MCLSFDKGVWYGDHHQSINQTKKPPQSVDAFTKAKNADGMVWSIHTTIWARPAPISFLVLSGNWRMDHHGCSDRSMASVVSRTAHATDHPPIASIQQEQALEVGFQLGRLDRSCWRGKHNDERKRVFVALLVVNYIQQEQTTVSSFISLWKNTNQTHCLVLWIFSLGAGRHSHSVAFIWAAEFIHSMAHPSSSGRSWTATFFYWFLNSSSMNSCTLTPSRTRT